MTIHEQVHEPYGAPLALWRPEPPHATPQAAQRIGYAANTLEKLRDCLRNLEPRVELSADVMHRALAPLERMLAVK